MSNNWDKLTQGMRMSIIKYFELKDFDVRDYEHGVSLKSFKEAPGGEVSVINGATFNGSPIYYVCDGNLYAKFSYIKNKNTVVVVSDEITNKVVFVVGHCTMCGFELDYCVCSRICENCGCDYPVYLDNPQGTVCPMCGKDEHGKYYKNS